MAGVASGVAVDSGLAAGVVSGAAVETGVAVGVVSGVAVKTGVAVLSGDPVGAAAALLSGVASVAGLDVAVAAGVAGAVLGAGVGELEGCPPDGVAGCCSHPARRKLETRATTKHLIMPTYTDARGRGIFKPRY